MMTQRHWILRFAALLAALAGFASPLEAGNLVLRNSSQQPLNCTIDGWDGRTFTVMPGTPLVVAPDAAHPAINSVTCGALTTRAMNINADNPTGTLVLNGRQTRVLNVALYPYIPNPPGRMFDNLLNHVIEVYQRDHPEVLLNVQMSFAVDIYDFAALQTALGGGGFDVIEIDTLYLGFLADSELVNPVRIGQGADPPFPVALNASTHNGQLWGIPSWLCTDFIFARDPAIRNVDTIAELLDFLRRTPHTERQMAGDYTGSWRLPSMYINAYVQAYGYMRIAEAMRVQPPDPAVIQNMIAISATCTGPGGNPCTDKTYHRTAGMAETAFANGRAGADMGFSEQSFYINLARPTPRLSVVPAVWGDRPRPLLFSDTFVTSSANCPPQSRCTGDSAAFTTLMTGVAMKTYIVQSQDLPAGSPWRTLLVATRPFYDQQVIRDHPLYRQYVPVLSTAEAFPNSFTSTATAAMTTRICAALKAHQPNYEC